MTVRFLALLLPLASGLVIMPPPLPLRAASTPLRCSAPIAFGGGGDEREISDVETGFRWIGVQGLVDSSIILGFAYDLRRKIGEDLPFEEFVKLAIQQPALKFLILMPALTIFLQILRRFGDETGVVVRGGSFEDDPIVKFLGGAKKVRSIRDRVTAVTTIKG